MEVEANYGRAMKAYARAVPPVTEMFAMRLRCLSILFVIIAGCVSKPPIAAPTTTPFDDNPEARAAFVKAYREGYLAKLSGQAGVVCVFDRDGIIGTAREVGWIEGQSAASELILQQGLRGVEPRGSK